MSKAKKYSIIVIVILTILAVSFISFILYLDRESFTSHDIQRYTKVADGVEYLPSISIDDLGMYSDLDFKYFFKANLIFPTEAYTLRVVYKYDDYEIEKDTLSEKYVYQSTHIDSDFPEYDPGKDPEFQIGTFHFKTLSLDEYNFRYPHQLVFVGISDETAEIAYVYFFGTELDYIDESFANFLIDECGWES